MIFIGTKTREKEKVFANNVEILLILSALNAT